MKSFVTALVLVASAAGPVLANECPTLQAQIDAAIGTRYDPAAANAKQLATEAWSLHVAGRHAESVAKYDEAAKAAGITLKHMHQPTARHAQRRGTFALVLPSPRRAEGKMNDAPQRECYKMTPTTGDIDVTPSPEQFRRVLDQRGRFLMAALGFARCGMPSYDRALWALRPWLDSWPGIGHVAVGNAPPGLDLQLTQYDERRLARDLLHDGHGAQPDERDRHRVGADAVARDTTRGVGGLESRVDQTSVTLLDALYAFYQEHERCGELDGDRVQMTCTCERSDQPMHRR